MTLQLPVGRKFTLLFLALLAIAFRAAVKAAGLHGQGRLTLRQRILHTRDLCTRAAPEPGRRAGLP